MSPLEKQGEPVLLPWREAACVLLEGGSMPSGIRTLNVCGERGSRCVASALYKMDGNERV
jgi:hypothetical protein